MAAITVRNLDDSVQHGLKRRAAANNRSMEAEVRAILAAAVGEGDLSTDWIRATAEFRGAELPLPPRSVPRDTDFS